MTWKNPACWFLCALSVAACVSPKIGYDYDRGANFGDYRTYEWMPGDQERTGDRRVDNSYTDIRLRTAVAARLLLKGYEMPANGQPDFYVTYHLRLTEMAPDLSTQYFSDGMTGRPFLYSTDTRSTSSAKPAASDTPSYMTGTLLIDIVDAPSKKLVWRGTAFGAVEPGLTSQQRDERIRVIVRDILSNFPPK